jgi:uncharacterized protein (TIGR02217 family)
MYLPKRFPDNIASEPAGGPGFLTEIAATAAGFEQRDERWPESVHAFDFSQGVKSTTDFKLIEAHFRMARGRLHHFRVRDWADFNCLRAAGRLVMLTSTTFQIHKVYGDLEAFEELRKITRVYPGSLQVWKDGALQTLTTHYDVDEETGVVEFVSSPGEADLGCALQFDVPCRYDTDQLQATLVVLNTRGDSYHAWKTVPLKEVRE